MTKRIGAALLILLSSLWAASPDTIQLKENAAITGRILTEKPDQVVVDIGYTVLVVPRNQVVKVLKSGAKSSSPTKLPLQPTSRPAEEGIYYTAAPAPPMRDVWELVKQLGEAVVQVRTPSGFGSGFIIHEEGYLITNFHVIEGDTQISVELYSQKGAQLERQVFRQVRIVALNKFADLVLLKIEDHQAGKLVRVPLGDSDALGVGDRVFAIGSPLGLERTVTEGILSTKTREIQGELYLQTTAQINPGNSGGPLFNLRGEVVGVTNMKITFGEGLGFAIPVEAVKYFLRHRDAFAYDNENPNNPYRYLEPPRRMRNAEAQP
jgi:serine protease Do